MSAAIATTITFAALTASPDRSIATICAQASQLKEQADDLLDLTDELFHDPQSRAELWASGMRAHAQALGLAGAAADIQAGGVAGLRAKAQLIVALSGEADDEQGRLATSLARDLMRLCG